jgi:hypothetical protein
MRVLRVVKKTSCIAFALPVHSPSSVGTWPQFCRGRTSICRKSRRVPVARVVKVRLWWVVTWVGMPRSASDKEPAESSRTVFHNIPWIESVDDGFDAHKASLIRRLSVVAGLLL